MSARKAARWPRGTELRYLLLALVAYLPLLLGRPGDANADTKLYLYLDPGGLLERARSLWDPAVGGGTVTHQTIGYLWPMGPYYWATDALGLPIWVAQRLWIGSIIFAAAAGALHLLDRLLPRHHLNLVGALAYGLSPYLLGHVTGQSALLLPFAALPWMVVFMARATSDGGWRWPAAYALVVTTCGSLNGSSVFFVVLGSALWPVVAGLRERPAGLRRATAALARCGLLTLLTQVWWLVAYWVGGRHGLPLLATTETLQSTSTTTSATEVLRGLGYWFFYGADVTGPWLDGIAPPYMQHLGLLAVSFVLPVLAVVLAGLIRWPHRAYFATLAVTGLVLAVGAYRAAGRSPFGAAFLAASESSDLVLSLRNTQRATPLLLLGLAGLLAAGLHALAARRQWLGRAGALLAIIAVGASLPAHWGSGYIAERFHHPGEPPSYWREASRALEGGTGRILEIPGIDFAAYRWGYTLDPVTPGLVDRPVVARELVPMGSAPGISLLNALDRSIQEGYFEPSSLAPVARLLGASDVVLRSDLEYERYRTVRPRILWGLLQPVPAGLAEPQRFGEGIVNRADPDQPMLDEVELAIPVDAEDPPALSVFAVLDAPPLVRSVPLAGGMILSGDGEGVVAAASAGLLDDLTGPLRYAAEVTLDQERLARALLPGTRLVITDSNRLRGYRWFSLRENVGATEIPGEPAIEHDPGDARIPPVPDEAPLSQSVAEHRGAVRVWASAYGNPTTMTPEYRAVMAFDGDRRTSWAVELNDFDGPIVLGIELEEPVRSESIVLHQAVGRPGLVPIEEVTLHLDGDPSRSVTAVLDDRSFSEAGQPVPTDGAELRVLEIEIVRAADGVGPSGFSVIEIAEVRVEEVIHLPRDLLDALGEELTGHPLALVMTRHRVNPAEVVRADPEPAMLRAFALPRPLDATFGGTARLSAAAPDHLVDELVGIPSVHDGGMTAWSRERLAGDLGHRASSAFDGRLDTAWRTPFGDQRGNWLHLASAQPFSLDELVLHVVADGHHSLPQRILLEVEGHEPRELRLPPISESPTPGATVELRLTLDAPLEGDQLRLTLLDIDERTTRDWYTGDPIALPVGLAHIELPGAEVPPAAARLDESCRYDLLELNGAPLGVSLHLDTSSALSREGIQIRACEGEVLLREGENLLRARRGADTGVDLDQVVLSAGFEVASPEHVAPAELSWRRISSTAIDVEVAAGGGEPFWLVVSESHNDGWVAHAGGVDLGAPEVHDAFGMGWLVQRQPGEELRIEIRWAPQRGVEVAMAASLLAVLGCLVLILRGGARPRAVLTASPHLTAHGVARSALCPALVALATGAVFISPAHGALLAVLIVAAARLPVLALPLGLLPGLLVAAAAAYVGLLQLRWGYPAGFHWPEHFARVHRMALLGPFLVMLLAWFDQPVEDPSKPTIR